MFASRTFGARDAELQSMLMALHKAHYHVHEDVVGILLHEDFRAEAMRSEYYATNYLRHRLPLLFRLALCKWRPHKRAPKSLLRKKGGRTSTDKALTCAGSAKASDADDEDEVDGDAQHHSRRCDGFSVGACSASSEERSLPSSSTEGCGNGGDVTRRDDAQRESWSLHNAPVAAAAAAASTAIAGAKGHATTSTTTAAEKRDDGLTPEQLTQLSILALQVLCGDRSRVREGSAEASTAACGPVWDVHTVRSFYEEHRRLVRWTCRVLHDSCEWVEDVVRRAVEDDLIEPPAPMSSPTHTTQSSSGNDDFSRERVSSTEQQPLPLPMLHTHVPTTRPARGRRTISVEVHRRPSSTSYSPQKDARDDRPVTVDPGWQQAVLDAASSTTSNDSGSDGHELDAHFARRRRHRTDARRLASPMPMLTRPPRPPQGANTPLHPPSECDAFGSVHGSALQPPPQASSPHQRTIFSCTAELEAALELHCRRIRHAVMVLESLLVSLALVQPYIYRTQPGRSNTPPWLRRESSGSSSGSCSASSSGSDEDDAAQDEVHSHTSEEDAHDGAPGLGGSGGFRRLRRRQGRRRSGKNGGLRTSLLEFRTDTSSSFETDHGGDVHEGNDEAHVLRMSAEADEPPLDLLVRHCMHAFTQTFLSITAVQQQLQEYSHESRHAPVSTTTATTNRSFAVVSALASADTCASPRLLPTYGSGNDRYASSAVSPVTPTESETPSLIAARGTPAAYACPRCQRFHQVEEVLLVAANANLEVLKKSAIALTAHHSAIAEESIRVIDAEGAVFTSQATMLLAHVLTPDLLTAHPPGSRGGMALEWVLNYVFGGCSGADVRQHQQQQERQHTAAVAGANSSFDCFSLANSSFSSTNPQSVDASDPDGRSSDGGWRSMGGEASNASDSGHSSAQSSGRWNVNRFECGDGMAEETPLGRSKEDRDSDGHDSPAQDNSRGQPEQQATNIRVEYILAACFTRCHPLMTVIGCVAENNQYNCGRTVAQAVLQYAFTLSQTSARLLRTPLMTNTWSTPFTEAMMRGLSELAAHAHQSVSVTQTVAQPGGLGGNNGGAGGNLTWSFSSASPAAAAAAAAAAAGRSVKPPQLMGPDRNFAPLLAAQLNVPTSLVSSAMRHVPRPKPYAFIPPPAAVVTGATPADDAEAAQVRTMRRCLALHWAKCVLLSARTLTRAGTYDVSVPFEHYVNIRNARVHLRERMTEYHDRMQEHFANAGNREKVRRLEEVFKRWEADEQRMALYDMDIAEYPNQSFTTATAPYAVQGTPTTPGLYTVDPFGRASPVPVALGEGAINASDPQTAEGGAGQSHFDSNRNSHTMTATFASFAVPAGTAGKSVATTTGTTSGVTDGVRDQLLLPQPDDSSPGSIGADPLGRSFDDTNATTVTEKESYRRAFVDSFCFGKSDFELLSAALLGKTRTAVLVPIHVIVYTSLFSILDAMGDVLLCEKPRLSSVVANELLTLLYEAQLSMLEPLHDGAMAVVDRTGSTTPATTPASSLGSSPALGRQAGSLSDTSDSFVSPGSSMLPSTVASSEASSSSASSRSSSCSPSSVTLSSDVSGSPSAFQHSSAQLGDRDGFVSDPESIGSGSSSSDVDLRHTHNRSRSKGSAKGIGGRCGSGSKRKKSRTDKKRNVSDNTVITRDGHILLFNEYALLLEAGLRTPLVVRRWRDDVLDNADHAARGYLSLLDHLQYRQSQWAEPSQDEYLVSRSTLRLMLGVTARDARGNMHGNILHVDDLDVMGSRKEEVAPRLGVTSSKDSLTMLYTEEWDPSMVNPADAQEHGSGGSGGCGTSLTSASSSYDRAVGHSKGLSSNLMRSETNANDAEDSSRRRPDLHVEALGRHVMTTTPVTAAPFNASGGAAGSALSHVRSSPPLLGRPPLPSSSTSPPARGSARMLGPRTSSFECVSLLGTRMETGEDGTPLQLRAGNILHQHHHDHIHTYVDADDIGNDSEDVDLDDKTGNDEDDEDIDDDVDDMDERANVEERGRCGDTASEGLGNFSFMSAETFDEEEEANELVSHGGSPLHPTASQPTQQLSQVHKEARAAPLLRHATHHPHAHHHASPDHGSSAHASHTQSHDSHHSSHHGHTRPSQAPRRHPPTKVTLAGVRGDLGTMVRRMPYTWTLEEPLGVADGEEESEAVAGQTNDKEREGGDRCNTEVARTATTSAPSTAASAEAAAAPSASVVHYAPVRVAPLRKEGEGSEDKKEEEAASPPHANAAEVPAATAENQRDAEAVSEVATRTAALAPSHVDASVPLPALLASAEEAPPQQPSLLPVPEGIAATDASERQSSFSLKEAVVAAASSGAGVTTALEAPLQSACTSSKCHLVADSEAAQPVEPGSCVVEEEARLRVVSRDTSVSSNSSGTAESALPVLIEMVEGEEEEGEVDEAKKWEDGKDNDDDDNALQENNLMAAAAGVAASSPPPLQSQPPSTMRVVTVPSSVRVSASSSSSPPRSFEVKAPVVESSKPAGFGMGSGGGGAVGRASCAFSFGGGSLCGSFFSSSPRNTGTADSVPLGNDNTPSNDAALSRAIERVLHHRRSLPSNMLSSSLTTLDGQLSQSAPSTPSPVPQAGNDRDGAAAAPRIGGGDASDAIRSNKEIKKTHSQRDSLNPRDIWQQTLSQLKQTTTPSSYTTATASSIETSSPESARSDPRRTASPASTEGVVMDGETGQSSEGHAKAREEADCVAKLNQRICGVDQMPESTQRISTCEAASEEEDQEKAEGTGDHSGDVRGPSPSIPHVARLHAETKNGGGSSRSTSASHEVEMCDQRSTDTVSPTSPATSHSGPHDMQWYTGGRNAAAHRPPRSTVSTDDPMSPIITTAGGSNSGSRFGLEDGGSPGGGLTAQVPVEGVMGGLRIGQGGGKSLLWPVGGKARQHSPPSEHLRVSEALAKGTGGVAGVASSSQSTTTTTTTTTAATASSDTGVWKPSVVTAVPDVQHAHIALAGRERGATESGAGGASGSAYNKGVRFSTSHTPLSAAFAVRRRGGGGGGGEISSDSVSTHNTNSSSSLSRSSDGVRALSELPPPCAMLNGKVLPESAAAAISSGITRAANNVSGSPLNTSGAGATGYVSGNESDVST